MNTEYKTVRVMIRFYCRKQHGRPKSLCSSCAQLLAYAEERIQKCPFGTDKPACNQCTVHCYRPELREQMKTVMRYSGPRMLLRHPLFAIRHLLRSKDHSGSRSK